MSENTIFTPGPEYGENFRRWELVRDLSGGQVAMVDAGTRWVLQGPKEPGNEYQERVEGAALNNGFLRAAKRATNRVFVREVEVVGIDEDDPIREWLDPLLARSDNESSSLTQVAAALHYTAARYGVAHWMVEHTVDRGAEGRPYVWPVDPLSLIDWVHDDDGRLTEVRIRGRKIERDPIKPWLSKTVETVRRYYVDGGERVISELYVQRQGQAHADAAPEMVSPLIDRNGRPLTEIPLVTLYFNRTGMFQASSPFEDLAYVTLRHWRSYIEQCWNLRTARIPVLGLFGFADAADPDAPGPTGNGEEVEISHRTVIQDRSAEAKATYVETTGAALEQGWKDLIELQQQMERFGDEPNSQRAGVQTATGVWLDDLSQQGVMALWTRADEMALTETVRLIARWRGQELPEDARVQIREEKPLQPADDRKQGRLGELFDRGVLTKRTYLAEMQRAGATSEAIDPDVEIASAEAESMEASRMMAQLDGGANSGFGDDDEGEDNG